MKFIKERYNDIIKVVVLSVIIIWVICFGIDLIRARQNKWPLFCVKESIKNYEDGTVEICTGVGYKMYKYKRSSIPVTVQFGPFFMEERTK